MRYKEELEGKGREKSKFNLVTVQWELTNRCNTYCKYCYVLNGRLITKELDNKCNYKIINALKIMNVQDIEFVGGEPLLKKDLILYSLPILREQRIHIITNGTLLNSQFLEEISGYRNVQITISLDNQNFFINELLRGKGTTKIVTDNIEMLNEYHISYGAATVISKMNYKYLEDFIIFLEEHNCNHLQLFELSPPPKNKKIGKYKLNNKEKETFKKRLDRIIEKENIIKIDASFLGLGKNEYKTRDLIRSYTGYFGCDAGSQKIAILPDGKVVPCLGLRTNPHILLNLFDYDFSVKDAWKQILRESFNIREKYKNTQKECIECLYSSRCYPKLCCIFGGEYVTDTC